MNTRHKHGYRVAALGLGLAALTARGAPPPPDRLQVLRTKDEIYVRSSFSTNRDLVVGLGLGANRQINFQNAWLTEPTAPMTRAALTAGRMIHGNGDDATPWKINGTYIGGNHGCLAGIEITCPKHGRTDADLGTEWQDATGRCFYLIRIVDADKVWALSRSRLQGGRWSFTHQVQGNTLTNRQGVAIAGTASQLVQIRPACRIGFQKVLLDGRTPLADGVASTGDWLDVVEEYDIINPASLLADAIGHPGEARPFDAPHLEAVIRNHIVYRFLPNGANVIYYTATALQPFDLEFMGFIQSARLLPERDQRLEYYIPKTIPFTQAGTRYDFRGLQDFSSPPTSTLFFRTREEGLEDPTRMPDRFIQLLTRRANGAAVREVGYALGYSPLHGLTALPERARNVGSPMMLHTTGKSYPHGIDAPAGTLIPAGTTFYAVAYRQYFDPRAGGQATCVYWQQLEDDIVVYADYHKAVAHEAIRLPARLTGKAFDVVEKTPSLTVLTRGTIPASGVAVSVTGDHGYVVLRISSPGPARP